MRSEGWEEHLESLDEDELRAHVTLCERIANSWAARGAAALARLDALVRARTGDSCAPQLGADLRLTPGVARALVRDAHALTDLRWTREALQEGVITPRHVRVICRAAEDMKRHGWNPVKAAVMEHDLSLKAQAVTPDELESFWMNERHRADPEAAVVAERELGERRWARTRLTRQGSLRLEAELDPENGAAVTTALAAAMTPPAADDTRTTDQRRADALGRLARLALDSGKLPARGGEKPHLFVMASVETLQLAQGSSMAKLDWGIDITGESARRIGCDASVTPVLVGREGDVLHVGTSARTTPPRMRKLINLRDRTCQTEGCGLPAEQCEPHHLQPWIASRWTDASTIKLYCATHHRRLHEENERYYRRAAAHRGPP